MYRQLLLLSKSKVVKINFAK